MNCDTCDDFSSDFSSGHFMRSTLRCSEYDEILVEVMADIFMLRELIFFM